MLCNPRLQDHSGNSSASFNQGSVGSQEVEAGNPPLFPFGWGQQNENTSLVISSSHRFTFYLCMLRNLQFTLLA